MISSRCSLRKSSVIWSRNSSGSSSGTYSRSSSEDSTGLHPEITCEIVQCNWLGNFPKSSLCKSSGNFDESSSGPFQTIPIVSLKILSGLSRDFFPVIPPGILTEVFLQVPRIYLRNPPIILPDVCLELHCKFSRVFFNQFQWKSL